MLLFSVPDLLPRNVLDYVTSGDIKGLIAYLNAVDERTFQKEVLKAGFSLISFSLGRNKVIAHVIDQVHSLGNCQS
ncbi:hypothetical protein [Thalassotalea marina]|uniref:Uncharacterized protein n=1 Tax=Thalassotalea marina TaxID=1673741 RepID=A0A919BRS7_9GAMM|nr:hypothetical protein [Thalassotalea marina]GHG07263.1 hypothetical protein GCM10017161_41250 [Thalassotalea marina]